MKKVKNDLLVYTTRRPFWHYIIAFPLYIFLFPLIRKMIELFYYKDGSHGLQFIVAIFFVFVCAAALTFTKRIYVNSTSKSIRFNFKLFGIQLVKDSVFNDVKYVSVYKNHTDRDFEIKLWLTEKKQETISVLFTEESAFKFAGYIAEGLDVDLLDATEKGNFKWIEKEIQK